MGRQNNNGSDNDTKLKKFIEVIKTDKQKRAWLILFGYFIFFLILIIMIRTNSSTSNYDTNSSNIKNLNISMIKNGNYYFKYTVNLDNQVTSYEGEKNSNKSLFNKSVNGLITNYYQENDSYYIKISDSWTISENPYILSNFMNINNIEKILEQSKYISKTEYEDYSKEYHYQISTTTLVKLLDSEIVDLDDIPNDIMVTTDSSNNVEKIEFNLSSYTNYKLLTTSSSSVMVEYSKFNEINDISMNLE